MSKSFEARKLIPDTPRYAEIQKYIEPFWPRLFHANQDGSFCEMKQGPVSSTTWPGSRESELEIKREFEENVDELKRRWFNGHEAEQCNKYCIGFSRRHNIVQSKRYLNLMIENGGVSKRKLN